MKWYQNSFTVILLSTFFGFCGWVFHAVFESFFFPDQTFLQLFITEVSLHDVILRLIVGGCFFIFGIVVCNTLTQQHITKMKLHDAYEQLRIINNTLEQKVEERTEEVRRLLKQKNDLIIGLNHDLKTPLTPLMGYLPMLLQEESNPKLKEIIEVSIRNIHYIRDLVSKSINLALLDSTVLGLTLEKTHLLTEINTVLDSHSYLIRDHDIYVEIHVDEYIFVHADKLRLREVLDNLFMNSIQYTPETGGVIIEAKRDKDIVIISVKDTGMGLSSNQCEHLFEELYKGDAARHNHTSTGLGLSICKRIVEKHNGKIWVESPGLGKGTTVFFTLQKALDNDPLITTEIIENQES